MYPWGCDNISRLGCVVTAKYKGSLGWDCWIVGTTGAVTWITGFAGLVGECRFLVARKRGAVGCGMLGSPLFARFLRCRLVGFLLWFPLLWLWDMDVSRSCAAAASDRNRTMRRMVSPTVGSIVILLHAVYYSVVQ